MRSIATIAEEPGATATLSAPLVGTGFLASPTQSPAPRIPQILNAGDRPFTQSGSTARLVSVPPADADGRTPPKTACRCSLYWGVHRC